MVGDDRRAHRRPAGSSTAPPIYCGPSRAAISNIRLRTHQSTPGRRPESTAGCGAAGFCCATKRGRMSYPRHSSSEPRIGALAQQRPRRSRQSEARAQRAPMSVGTRIRADSLPIREQCARPRSAPECARARRVPTNIDGYSTSANPDAKASRRCGAMSDLAADILASRGAGTACDSISPPRASCSGRDAQRGTNHAHPGTHDWVRFERATTIVIDAIHIVSSW